MSLAHEIREYVNRHYIEPARKAGAHEVIFNAKEIYLKMELEKRYLHNHRYPALCDAITTKIFERDYRVQLVCPKRPRQGMRTQWTYEIIP